MYFLRADVDNQKLALVNLIVRNYQFSWEKICTALEEMEDTNLATQIRSKYCHKDTAHSESTSQDQLTSGKTLYLSDRKMYLVKRSSNNAMLSSTNILCTSVGVTACIAQYYFLIGNF